VSYLPGGGYGGVFKGDKTMKILNLRDTHFRAKNSVHRVGNMYQDIMAKLDEVIELSKGCALVIHDGDVFDSPYVSNSVIDDVIDKIENANIPWYITVGNHDMSGANWGTSKSSALAHVFRRSKLIHELDEIKTQDVYIKSFPYYYACEEDIKKNGLKHDQEGKFTIASTHAFISIKPFLKQVLHVQAKDIKSDFDLVLCSHFHDVFDENINNSRFVNSGSLCRLSITERKHQPQVLIIDTKTKEVEFIKLKSAKPFDKVFDMSKVDEKKIFNADIEKFIKSIESTQFQEMSITGMINQIAKEEKVDKKVVELIFNKIGELE
jgi:DNA repair exonuclease SbcCD nuclease subunit